MNSIKRVLLQVVSLTSLGCFAAACQPEQAPRRPAVQPLPQVVTAPAPKPAELTFCAPVASYQPAVAVKARAARKQATTPRVVYTRRYVTLAEFIEILDAKEKDSAAEGPAAPAPIALAAAGNP